MSAIAQYLCGAGKKVSGSDRYFASGHNETRDKLIAAGIDCFLQDGSGITEKTQLVVVSTAIEDTVPEVQKAKALQIPILKRAEILALIAESKKTIAVAGTSGKSTTSAMLYHIMEYAGLGPGIISGAGLTSLIKQGKLGNAKVGKSEWLVIEADESDGSIVLYKPDTGVLLNIDKDHKELDELNEIFTLFKNNTKRLFSVNRSHALTKPLSQNVVHDFSADENIEAGFTAANFTQEGFQISFTVNGHPFAMQLAGKHNMENALAATAIACQCGVSLIDCAAALQHYEGIYRRHQFIGKHKGICVIDDYAHNPAKCAASIAACKPIAPKLIAWFQPHGYGPTRFLRHDFVQEIAAVLRENDEIWMSEIFYAGGTAVKDISAADLINDLKALGKNAFFVEDRHHFIEKAKDHFTDDCVLLLMGARDPSLEQFAQEVWKEVSGLMFGV